MTNAEALIKVRGYLTDYLPLDSADEIDEIIQALEQQSSEDGVARSEALDILDDFEEDVENGKFKTAYAKARERMCNLQSVTPQPKIGHWIIVDDCEQFIAKCSECGKIVDSRMIKEYPYCHCGAKMEVKE